MPKKIDPKVKERCVQQMLEHAQEYPNPTAAAEAVARRNGVGTESVRRWYLQAQVDGGQRRGATSEELAEIRELETKVRRLEEDLDIATRASIFWLSRRECGSYPGARSCGRWSWIGPQDSMTRASAAFGEWNP